METNKINKMSRFYLIIDRPGTTKLINSSCEDVTADCNKGDIEIVLPNTENMCLGTIFSISRRDSSKENEFTLKITSTPSSVYDTGLSMELPNNSYERFILTNRSFKFQREDLQSEVPEMIPELWDMIISYVGIEIFSIYVTLKLD